MISVMNFCENKEIEAGTSSNGKLNFSSIVKKDKVAATKSGLRFAYAKNDFNLQVRQILKDLSL